MPVKSHTPAAPTCREYASEAEFAALERDWRELHADSATLSVFTSWDWNWLWWKSFRNALPEGRAELLIITVTVGDELVGIAPFTYPARRRAAMPVRLRSFGDEARPETMNEEPTLLIRRGCERMVPNAIASHLLRLRACPWDCAFLQYSNMTEENRPIGDCSVASAPDTLSQLGGEVKALSVAQRANLPSTWAEFRKGLSRSMKDNLAYYPRKLDKAGHQWRVLFARSPADVAVACEQLYDLHNARIASQRGVAHTNHLKLIEHKQFLRDSLVALSAVGSAWLVLLEIDGVISAAQAFLESGGIVTFYYSGYLDSAYDYSPLLILGDAAIKDAIARGNTSISLLPQHCTDDRGSYAVPAWKTRWGCKSYDTVWQWSCAAHHARGLVFASGRRVARLLRGIDKSSQAPRQSKAPAR